MFDSVLRKGRKIVRSMKNLLAVPAAELKAGGELLSAFCSRKWKS